MEPVFIDGKFYILVRDGFDQQVEGTVEGGQCVAGSSYPACFCMHRVYRAVHQTPTLRILVSAWRQTGLGECALLDFYFACLQYVLIVLWFSFWGVPFFLEL